jgi:hypothetical protein
MLGDIAYLNSAFLLHISVVQRLVHLLDRLSADVMLQCAALSNLGAGMILKRIFKMYDRRTYSTFLWVKIGRHGRVL